jgi:hypothetical protein
LFLFAKQTNPNQSKKEVNGTVISPPLVFPGLTSKSDLRGITKCDQIHGIDYNEFDHTKVAAFVQPSGL